MKQTRTKILVGVVLLADVLLITGIVWGTVWDVTYQAIILDPHGE